MDRMTKIYTIFVCIIIAIGIFTSTVVGEIYPTFIVCVVLVSAIGIGYGLWTNSLPYVALVIPIIVGIVFRYHIFQFSGSLYTTDPIRYLIEMQSIMKHNSISASDLTFYQTAAAFYMVGISVSSVLDISLRQSFSIYSILIPIISGLFIGLMVRRFAQGHSLRTLFIGTLFGSVGAVSILYGYAPIPETLSILILFPIIWSIIKMVDFSDRRVFIVILLSGSSLLFTHKLAVVLLTFILTIYLIIEMGVDRYSKIEIGKSLNILVVSAIFILLSYVQLDITNFLREVVFSIGGLVGILDQPSIPPSPTFPFAVSDTAHYPIIRNIGYYLLALIPNVIIGLYYICNWPSQASRRFILVTTGVTIGIASFSIIFSLGSIPERFIFFAYSFMIILLISSTKKFWKPQPSRILFLTLFIAIIMFSVSSPALIPGDGQSYRYHLTPAEMNAHNSIQTHFNEEMATDQYFAHRRSIHGENIFRPNEIMYLSKNFSNQEYIAHRSTIDVYRYREVWKLTYEATQYLDLHRERVWSNGDVSVYI